MNEPSAYLLPVIPYLRLQLTLEAEEPASLPPFHGSMLRGAFGHALRRTVCVMGPEQPCASCLLRHACVYTRIFEPYVEGEPPPFLRGIDQAVRPYVFEPIDGEGRWEPGSPLRFDLLLFGQAVDLQAYAFLAVERMARSGLGSRRARFRLVRVEALEAGGSTRQLFAAGSPPSTAPAPPVVPPESALPEGPVTLHLVTPLRIKLRDHLNDHPRFRDLAFNMLRRVLELAHFHVPGAAIDWSFRTLLDRADGVRVVSADLHWHDWERWSQRQQTSMKLGGLVGRLVLEGDLAPFTALLRAAEIVHVGKGATFGLGKVVVEGAAGSAGVSLAD
ncbi:MAG TPA: CRISPR system precrRNA processing endoribonuclease RAMP protein Cas6 [Thermoanaerobaculia bacterium]|nr:CRISPR system precrRNA processing endoribonuclease RAMP protein Cas6 [Thermoanaerobaculia bacterium]